MDLTQAQNYDFTIKIAHWLQLDYGPHPSPKLRFHNKNRTLVTTRLWTSPKPKTYISDWESTTSYKSIMDTPKPKFHYSSSEICFSNNDVNHAVSRSKRQTFRQKVLSLVTTVYGCWASISAHMRSNSLLDLISLQSWCFAHNTSTQSPSVLHTHKHTTTQLRFEYQLSDSPKPKSHNLYYGIDISRKPINAIMNLTKVYISHLW